MAFVEFSDEDDGRLEALAPDYLKGPRMKARRIRWGIETLGELLTRKVDSETESPPASAAATDAA